VVRRSLTINNDGAMLITKSVPKRICATFLLFFAVVGGRALYIFPHTANQLRGVGDGQLLQHVLLAVASFFFAGLWLLLVTPAITVPCAAYIALDGLWVIWSACTGMRPDRGFAIVTGIIFCCPAAIEVRRLTEPRKKPLHQ